MLILFRFGGLEGGGGGNGNYIVSTTFCAMPSTNVLRWWELRRHILYSELEMLIHYKES
jgi:hypothetical protein